MAKRKRVGARPTHLVLVPNPDAVRADQERRRSSAAQPHDSDKPRATTKQELREENR